MMTLRTHAALDLVRLLRGRAERLAASPAFLFLENGEGPGTECTYAELDRRARLVATHLQRLTRPGDRVMLSLPSGSDFVAALYGCWYAGTVAVPTYPADPNSLAQSMELAAGIAGDAGPRVVLTTRQGHALFGQAAKDAPALQAPIWLCMEEPLTGNPEEWREPSVAPDDLAVLLYTSGSTGAPKGVMLDHGNLLHDAHLMLEGCQAGPGDRWCVWLPPYHVSGLFAGLVLPVYAGGPNVTFSPRHFLERPLRWVEAISRYGVTISGAPTFAYGLCAAAETGASLDALDLRNWRTAVIGGEAIRPEVLASFVSRFGPCGFRRTSFYPMFGLTEAVMISTGGRPEREPALEHLSRAALGGKRAIQADEGEDSTLLVGSGRSLPGLDVRVADPEGLRECADGEIGEILIAGRSVAQGYWNKPVETEQTFGAYLQSGVGPYLRTGDMGYLRGGELFVTGRIKELVIVRGLNYYPEDLERTVRESHPVLARSACAAFALQGEDEEQLGIAIESVASEEAREELAGTVRAAVARRHGVRPRTLAFAPPGGLPRTNTGKIRRKACAERVTSGAWPVSGERHDPVQRGAGQALARESLLAAVPEERFGLLLAWLQEQLGAAVRLPASEIGPDEEIGCLGVDSIQTVKLSTEIHSVLGIRLPVRVFFDGTTPRRLAESLLDELSGKRGAVPERINFPAEAVLEAGIRPLAATTRRSATGAVFLTGATGFLGGFLLHSLLERTTATVHCLVRAKDGPTALQRIERGLREAGLWHPSMQERLRPVVGDLSLPQFGLSRSEFERLCAAADAIYHNGASVDFVAPYLSVREVNVRSTVECLRLACLGAPKRVHFVSSLAVFNCSGRHLFQCLGEEQVLDDPNRLFGGYPQSKWVGEALVREAGRRGLPVSVYRPGLVTGHSRTGHFNQDDFLCRFLKGCLQLGAFPDLEFDLDMTPVDYVAEALVHLSLRPDAAGQTFHLANPAPLSYRALLDWLWDFGYPVRRPPYEEWQRELQESVDERNALYPLLPFLTERGTDQELTFLELFSTGEQPRFDARNTRRGLEDSPVGCAPADGRLLETYFRQFIRSGFLPPAPLRGATGTQTWS